MEQIKSVLSPKMVKERAKKEENSFLYRGKENGKTASNFIYKLNLNKWNILLDFCAKLWRPMGWQSACQMLGGML